MESFSLEALSTMSKSERFNFMQSIKKRLPKNVTFNMMARKADTSAALVSAFFAGLSLNEAIFDVIKDEVIKLSPANQIEA